MRAAYRFSALPVREVRSVRMMPPLRKAAWVLLLLVLQASPVRADRREDARAAAQRGDRAFRKRAYADALAEYQASWDQYPKPFLLFRLAECHRLLDHEAEALAAYRSYLEKVRRSPDRPKAEQHAAELEQRLAARRPEPPPPAPVVQSTDVETPPLDSKQIAAQDRERDRRRKHDRRSNAPPSETTATAPKSERTPPGWDPMTPLPEIPISPAESRPKLPLYKRWWLWTAIGGGVVIAVALGVGLGLGLNQFDSELPIGGPGVSALSVRGSPVHALGMHF
jgi:hypothetical protein